MFEDLEELTSLEILELGDGGTIELRPISWKLGKYTIRTVRTPEGKTIQILRLYVRPEEKAIGPNYWDLTSQTLIAQILPRLQAGNILGRIFRITKHGVAPRARFTFEII